MNLKKVLMTAMAMSAITASAMAANPLEDKLLADTLMEKWAEQAKQGDTYTPQHEADRLYIHNNMRITYYDEWAVPKEIANGDFTNIGLPSEWAEQAFKGGGDDDTDADAAE